MNWDAVGAIAEGLGALGVIVTVAYLALQVQQNTRATRSAAHQSMFDNVHEVQLRISEDHELAAIVVRANTSFDDLSEEEQLRFTAYAGAVIGEWENVFFQHFQGTVEPEMWNMWNVAYREVLSAPGFKRVWSQQKSRVLPDFREFVEDYIG